MHNVTDGQTWSRFLRAFPDGSTPAESRQSRGPLGYDESTPTSTTDHLAAKRRSCCEPVSAVDPAKSVCDLGIYVDAVVVMRNEKKMQQRR